MSLLTLSQFRSHFYDMTSLSQQRLTWAKRTKGYRSNNNWYCRGRTPSADPDWIERPGACRRRRQTSASARSYRSPPGFPDSDRSLQERTQPGDAINVTPPFAVIYDCFRWRSSSMATAKMIFVKITKGRNGGMPARNGRVLGKRRLPSTATLSDFVWGRKV